MKNTGLFVGVIILGIIIIVVVALSQNKLVSPVSSTTSGETATNGETSGTNDQFCTLTANDTLTLYSRPTKDSQVFGTLASGESVTLGGKTADGWFGFDPGVAQAPNVGPFRLRYIAPGEKDTIVGNCSNLSVVVSLPANTCFMMAQTDISIYQDPKASSSVVTMMHFGDYIPAVGKTKGTADYWLKVDGTKDSTIQGGIIGWIASADINFNGPDCTKLPVVTK